MLLLSEQSGKSKHQEPLISSESNRAAGLSSCVDCADHRKARRSCQIARHSMRVFTMNSRLYRTLHEASFYSNRWSWNSRLLKVHDTAFFALGLMKDSARESLSYYLTASLRDKCSLARFRFKGCELRVLRALMKKYQRRSCDVKVLDAERISESMI